MNIQDAQSKLQTVVNSHPEATIGISYIDLKSGATANVNGDTAFTAASTGKMIPAIMFLQGVESGKYSLSQRYGSLTGSYLLKQMINRSNNECWATFNNLLGLGNEQAFATNLGLDYNPYKNTLSANDYATLLSKLYNNELLRQNNRDLLMGFMTNTNEERLIPAAVESGTVYHKYGMLEGYIHDGAIVDTGDRQYVLVVYTNNDKNYDPILRSKIFQEAVEAVTPES